LKGRFAPVSETAK